MITEETFAKMALSLPGTETKPHFDRIGFKVRGKRMFATYLAKDNTANVFLTPAEQYVFCKVDDVNIYPVPNKWGLNGATTFNLNNVSAEILQEALDAAFTAIISTVKKKR